MANTRDTIGDQATVDGLVSNTLTALEENGVTTIRSYALRNRTALTTIDLSGSSAVTINSDAFNGCTNLTHLVIRSSTRSTLSGTSALTGTKIALGDGGIYVPSNLLSSYKTASNWSTFAANIFPLEDYPRSIFDTISDTWAEIIAACANDTYKTKYAVGDTKALDFGSEGIYKMQIVAFDEDNLASGTGKAHITWICKDILPTTYKMNSTSTTTGGYEATAMRTYLSGTILPKLPAEVQAAILEVSKVQSTYENSAIVKDGQTTTEKLWIPSDYEVGLGTIYETTGARYATIFPSGTGTAAKSARIKKRNGSASYWWLRSAYSSTSFRIVNGSGYGDYYNALSTNGVVPGFCI